MCNWMLEGLWNPFLWCIYNILSDFWCIRTVNKTMINRGLIGCSLFLILIPLPLWEPLQIGLNIETESHTLTSRSFKSGDQTRLTWSLSQQISTNLIWDLSHLHSWWKSNKNLQKRRSWWASTRPTILKTNSCRLVLFEFIHSWKESLFALFCVQICVQFRVCAGSTKRAGSSEQSSGLWWDQWSEQILKHWCGRHARTFPPVLHISSVTSSKHQKSKSVTVTLNEWWLCTYCTSCSSKKVGWMLWNERARHGSSCAP